MDCNVYNHVVECACPPGYVGDVKSGCARVKEKCKADNECPSQTACFNGQCINPCTEIKPCGINAECKVLDTSPIRTMICECLPGYRGNAVVRCDPLSNLCPRGQIRDEYGNCVCSFGFGKDENDECIPCKQSNMVINDEGYCVCDLEKGFSIDENGRCVCPTRYGYRIDASGYCRQIEIIECTRNDDCADDRYCDKTTRTCQDPCKKQQCGVHALCNATRHQAICVCINGYLGNPYTQCYDRKDGRTDFPRPEMDVSCLSDGVQVVIHLQDQDFDGVLYVKGRSKDEQCRRVVSIPAETEHKTETFKVAFGNCGLIHVNGQASFVLVIQKHPKLMTYKAQAYHIKCIYQTGEQNVTLGFNVSMLTTAGTIANTGPPPICIMKIVAQNGNEINSAEIGDNLMLQVEVQPSTIYGGFARNCVAKTMEDNLENEYIVTDENGCATDPTIFGEWEQNPDTQSLMASFNAFKFPSSDNIRFQCNIRVCFGRCQPVNCRGYNAFGRRRRDVDSEINDTSLSISDGFEGQLREEITIQSNLIFTLERREERYTADPAEAPSAQRVEDICVSMVGFIIALIITALLALVAVAIAVSCWLMAYRRQPKTAGPLPHPPEFPNPLFTTESVAEPSPDYHLS
ncbi:Cuticlin-3 [Formica fusca]